ncbi:MAG: hypothetical protein A2294_01075 [Candidatus Magasanikbacteria bacterium RIFOXYB2_FULL_38_10]|nr:MAG: hypothetical protein A2294_01075 [Candidatus Magasanikbacteria bacterium RIFOXYB2_FULL_38_10]
MSSSQTLIQNPLQEFIDFNYAKLYFISQEEQFAVKRKLICPIKKHNSGFYFTNRYFGDKIDLVLIYCRGFLKEDFYNLFQVTVLVIGLLILKVDTNQ